MESIDHHFAARFSSEEEPRLFVAYLLAATRAGHLCVEVDGDQITPSPESIGLTADPRLAGGSRALAPSDGLICDGKCWYLARSYLAERLVVDAAIELATGEPQIAIDGVEPWLDAQTTLSEEQKGLVRSCCHQRLTLLCGGPGTGKSYTVSHLLTLFKGQSIAVTAPTGKAVGNLRSSLQKGGHCPRDIEIGTLHSLLKIYDGSIDFGRAPPRLEADLIVVDEASMIDVALFAHLLRSVKPGARLLLMGDPGQLPPVEAGAPFADLAAALGAERLTCCMRAELESIIDLSDQISQGDAAGIAVRPLKEALDEPSLQLLSPIRKGPYGVERINQRLVERAISSRRGALELPLLICRNDHRLQLCNGETGVFVCHGSPYHLSDGDYALFPYGEGAPFADGDLARRKIPAALLPNWEFAYCMSIHKSQGSEFDEVGVVIPEGAEGLSRELLYTAVTRAKRRVEIFGEERDLAAALDCSVRRHSRIKQSLCDALGGQSAS